MWEGCIINEQHPSYAVLGTGAFFKANINGYGWPRNMDRGVERVWFWSSHPNVSGSHITVIQTKVPLHSFDSITMPWVYPISSNTA